MPRWVLVLIGFVAIGAFLLLIFWPNDVGQAPLNEAAEALPGDADAEWDLPEGNPRAGQQLAQNLCARCHAVGPAGASPVGDAPPFRQFSAMWPLEYLDEALAEGIMVGHREYEMPVFQFDVQEIADLTAYLEELGESNRESD